MDSVKVKKSALLKIICYYIFISFLFPGGYISLNNVYKTISSVLIWSSVILIWIYVFIKCYCKEKQNGKFVLEKNFLFIMFYFVYAILITLILRKGKLIGLQQLISFPSIFVFVILSGKENLKILLNCINNIMLILFSINIIMTKTFFVNQYHITFLGHVQMISQLGVLAIFTVILYDVLYQEKKIRKIILVVLIEITLITTDASLALMTAILLVVLFIISKTRFNKILLLNSKIYIICGIIFNIAIVLISIYNNSYNNNYISWLDFSGRSFVWKVALNKIFENPIFGYGVQGVLLQTFWSKWTNSSGFNYAHNQILQNFLDGGIILSIAFANMLFSFCKNTKYITNDKCKVLCNIILILILNIMIFESTTIYCYYIICLSFIYVLSVLSKSKFVNEEEINGTNS